FRRIAPGTDYLAIPAGADDRPRWSVVVGLTAVDVPRHNLRLHRFRVAASGRILSGSDDVLETFRHVAPDDVAAEAFSTASAYLSNDGGHQMHLICRAVPLNADGRWTCNKTNLNKCYRSFSMDLGGGGGGGAVTPLGDLPTVLVPGGHFAIQAGGENWVLSVERPYPWLDERSTTRLLMRRQEGQRWVLAGEPHEFLHTGFERSESLYGSIFQGRAVIGNDKILVSLADAAFFVFDCTHCVWTPLSLTHKKLNYIPLSNRSVYVEDHNAVYFLRFDTLFAYKFSPGKNTIEPPIRLDVMCPFGTNGYGSLVHLAGQVMCVVWISTRSICTCTTQHVMITTLIINGDCINGGFVPKDVGVLHSTCRSLVVGDGRETTSRCNIFCFSLSYVEDVDRVEPFSIPPVLGEATYSEIEDSPNMLECCRMFLEDQWNEDDVVLEKCTTKTKMNLFFISQSGCQSLTYQISISNGKLLVGLTDTLQSVYLLKRGSSVWTHCKTTSRDADLTEKINISGFVVLKRCFMVSDAGSFDCFLLDLDSLEWTIVKSFQSYRRGTLLGRSIYIGGFIYTLFTGGILAFELIKNNGSYYLDVPVFLRTWSKLIRDKNTICFTSVSEGKSSSGIVFCLAHGYPCYGLPKIKNLHNVKITMMQVTTRETVRGTREPVKPPRYVDVCTNSFVLRGWMLAMFLLYEQFGCDHC
ncbi:Os10g0462300, partial [Oryza sativa Japonica Group]